MGLQLSGLLWALAALGSLIVCSVGALVGGVIALRRAPEGRRAAHVRAALLGPLSAASLAGAMVLSVRWASDDAKVWLDQLWLVPPLVALAVWILVARTLGASPRSY